MAFPCRWLTIFLLPSFLLVSLSVDAHSFWLAQLSTQKGLSHNSINTLYQDHTGFLWIGTKKGLNRFDAHGVQVFRATPADSTTLSGEDIYSVFEDESETLWIGTYSGGLNAYNKSTGQFRHYMFDADDESSINSNDVRCIDQGPMGHIWVGTWGGGVNVLNDRKNGTFEHYKKEGTSLSSNNITTFWRSADNTLWIGTWQGGLNVYDPESGQFDNYFDSTTTTPRNVTDIASIYGEEQQLWVASWGQGLFRFDQNSQSFEKINLNVPARYILCVYPDKEGYLWIGTEKNGLYRAPLSPEDQQPLQAQSIEQVATDHVNTLFRDESGTLWVGTADKGVYALHPPKACFQHIHKNNGNSINNNKVMGLAEVNPRQLVIGTYGGGINVWDRQTNDFTTYTEQDGLSNNDLWTLTVDNEGVVWAGTWGGGLNRLDLETGSIKTFGVAQDGSSVNSNDIRYIFQDSRGYIWISSWGNGLNRYNKSTQSFTYFRHQPGDTTSLSANNIWAINEDKHGNIWVGTWGGGLNRYDPDRERFRRFRSQTGDSTTLSDNYIYCLYYEPVEHTMWVGTSNGLNRFNLSTHTAQRFYQKDGLPSNIITSIEEGKQGYLWISTAKGISRLDRSLVEKKSDNPELSIFKNYTPADGLQANEFNQNASCRGHDGTLYFGGVKGFNLFKPQEVMGNTQVPPIVLTALKKYGNTVQLDTPLVYKKHLALSYQDNFFSIEFAALNYIQPDQNRYAYKLEGFDKDWNYIGNFNVASYTNIPGGEYTFKVKGANNDGVWNEEGAQLRITVVPPFWKTNTFYIGCALFILLAFYVIYRLRVRALRKTKQTLERQVRERTAHIREQKEEIETINQDLTNSINYAKRIQEAILPPAEELDHYFEDSFILFYPRDVVSGDFYWTARVNGSVIFTVVDCTGHGVPGAFMSMIGNDLLNHTITEAHQLQPQKILQQLDQGVQQALRQKGQSEEMKDGMDLALCRWDTKKHELVFAGAHNPLYRLRDGELKEIKGDPYPIGGYFKEKSFSEKKVSVQAGDQLYLFSDGYPDQFGGPRGKKFMYKRFKQLLVEIHEKPMDQQQEILGRTIKDWMAEGQEEQLDDICVMGVRIQ
jgi:ligand-binding sensor domain-containing protein/serine phosphatase RsbU (regulator of sigma subunit)